MRLTPVRNATHLGYQFKIHWMLKRKRKITPTLAESVLAERNIAFVDAETVLRPSLQEEPYTFDPERGSVNQLIPAIEKPPILLIGNNFSPIESVAQSQLLTNSIVFHQLPDETLKKVEETKDEDIHFLKSAIIKAHILDARQDRLPLVLDVVNEPGYKPARGYGPKSSRIIKSLMYQMVLYNNLKLPFEETKNIISDVMCRADVIHSGRELHFKFRENLLMCSKKPLAPVLGSDAVKAGAGASMPDISPFTTFVHVSQSTKYPDRIERFCIPGGAFVPHTVFLDFTRIRPLRNQDEFTAKTLLRAFGNAAAFAREVNPDATGDLDSPVTINLIHSTGNEIQFSKYQLNTLDMTGPTKNYLWFSPLEKMFTKVKFEGAKPTIQDLNPLPISTMNALINS